ncbi:hypothetical protein EXIGLDRAFT_777767 [Exidia glandulosa HHB12029]|uniref:Chromo domain-containing protein n=1 Tax=Exidia glandulosa HHB12029 TaxID=1314781 RepID=A0A165CVQ8_EXIGL|nr:hypothetical protein EXIGLDRAFT_777767 [Exidia glandulosa HHB12029]
MSWTPHAYYQPVEILDDRFENGRVGYLVRYTDTPAREASWEDRDTLDCGDLLDEYHQRFGAPRLPNLLSRFSGAFEIPERTTAPTPESISGSEDGGDNVHPAAGVRVWRDPHPNLHRLERQLCHLNVYGNLDILSNATRGLPLSPALTSALSAPDSHGARTMELFVFDLPRHLGNHEVSFFLYRRMFRVSRYTLHFRASGGLILHYADDVLLLHCAPGTEFAPRLTRTTAGSN